MRQNEKATIAALKFATKLALASLREPGIRQSVWEKRRRYYRRLLWLLDNLDSTAGRRLRKSSCRKRSKMREPGASPQ